MNTLRQELTRKLKYCEIRDNDEFHGCIDIYDIASDEPFCSVWFNKTDDAFGIGMCANHFDVCQVNSSFEYGNVIRDDMYIAKSCTLRAVVALVIGLHIEVTPVKRAAYKHIKHSVYGDAGSILT